MALAEPLRSALRLVGRPGSGIPTRAPTRRHICRFSECCGNPQHGNRASTICVQRASAGIALEAAGAISSRHRPGSLSLSPIGTPRHPLENVHVGSVSMDRLEHAAQSVRGVSGHDDRDSPMVATCGRRPHGLCDCPHGRSGKLQVARSEVCNSVSRPIKPATQPSSVLPELGLRDHSREPRDAEVVLRVDVGANGQSVTCPAHGDSSCPLDRGGGCFPGVDHEASATISPCSSSRTR